VEGSRPGPSTGLLGSCCPVRTAHVERNYKESANSIIYRRTGSDAWKPVRKGLPDPQGLRIPVVAANSSQPGVFYCSTEGVVYRSEDDGLQWQKLAIQWNTKATAEHATGMAIVEEG
jgi:hypothetical protein